MSLRFVTMACVVCLCAGSLLADEIVFKNGDRLSGTITAMDGQKISITSAVAGDVAVPMEQVSTFSTDAPIYIHLKDGTVLHQRIAAAPDGQFATDADGTVQAQSFPLSSIATINPPKVKWTGSLAVGALFTRGNSYSDNANAEFNAQRRSEDDRTTLNAGYFYGRQKDEDTGESTTNTDNWFAAGKYDYFLSPKWYAYGNTRVERDRIEDLDLRLTPGAGLGYQWIESPRENFNTEAGLTWVYENYSNPDRTEDYIAGRFAYHYDRQLNGSVRVFHDLELLPSIEDLGEFLLDTQLGLRASLTKRMFAEFKVVWQHNSQPAPEAQQNDLRYVVNVGWLF